MVHKAMVYHETGDGRKVGILDRGKLRSLRMERTRQGREVLGRFEEWLVRHQGLSVRSAQSTRALAWNTLLETNGQPLDVVSDPLLNYQTYLRIRGAITKLCLWMLSDPKASDEDREWARDTVNLVSRVSRTRQVERPTGSKDKKVRPVDDETAHKVLEAVTRLGKKEQIQRPWLGPVLRIRYLTGVGSPEVVCLRSFDVRRACNEMRGRGKKKPTWVPVWTKDRRRKSRAVPGSLIRDELFQIDEWPWEWGIVADVIAPHRQTPEQRIDVASREVSRHSTRVLREAGVLEDGMSPIQRTHQLKWWAWARMFKQTKDWVMLQQLSGMSISRLKQYPFLRDIEYGQL